MITAAYTLLTVLTLVVCAMAAHVRPQAREVLAAALFVVIFNYAMLVGIEVVNLAGFSLKPPASMILYPVMDAVCVGLCGWSYLRHRTTWKLCLGFGFLAQVIGHVVFWSAWEGSRHAGNAQLFAYIAYGNCWSFYQLLVLGFAGGDHAAHWIVDRAALLNRSNNRRTVRAG